MTEPKSDDPLARWGDRTTSFFTQANEAAIKAGENTFRACLLINGGAAVSVLAFIGNLASKVDLSQLPAVAEGLTAFAGGVVAAVFGMALSYPVNFFNAKLADSLIQRPARAIVFRRLTRSFLALTLLAGVASIALFVCGIWVVRNSIEHIQPATHTQASCAKPSP